MKLNKTLRPKGRHKNATWTSKSLAKEYWTSKWKIFRANQLDKALHNDFKIAHRVYVDNSSIPLSEYNKWLHSGKPLCVACLIEHNINPATVLDHIHPVSKGGDMYDPNNVQWLCESHHNQKSSKENK